MELAWQIWSFKTGSFGHVFYPCVWQLAVVFLTCADADLALQLAELALET